MKVTATTTTPWQIDASRLAVLQRLADDLAHEIKNPLHSMVINLEVLRTKLEKGATDAALERAEVLEHEIRRLHALIEAWLRLVRPPGERDATTSLALILDEVLPLLSARARLARVAFQPTPMLADAFTTVPADLLRFGLLLITERVLEDAQQSGSAMWLTTLSEPEEIQLRIGLAGTPVPPLWRAAAPDDGSAPRGIPAAASLLDPVGCQIEVESGPADGQGCAILLRVPRLQFL